MSDLWKGGQDDPIAYSRDSNRACRCCNGGVYPSDYVRTDARNPPLKVFL